MPLPLLSPLALLLVAPFIGSFLGVLIKRLPEERPVMVARSACDHCQRTLAWRDLIPVVSWYMARGRCRYCGWEIGRFYPLVEMAAFGIALMSVLLLPGWIAWAGAGFGWTLLTLAWIDQEHYLLPDAIIWPLALAGLAMTWLIDSSAFLDHVIGTVAGFGLFTGVAWLYRLLRRREGLGGGDAKLLAALGAWVAWQGLPTVILYAAASGLALTLALAMRGQRLELGHRMPFGPHLCLAGWLVWLYGPLVPL